MTIKKIRSPDLTVIQASSFALPIAGMWSGTDGVVHTPNINGNILAVITSFNSNDTDATFNVVIRDLKSTAICLVTDWSTNKASAIRFPQFYPTSAASATAMNTIAANSGGIGIPLPVCGSLEITVAGGTSGNTAICEIYYDQ